MTQSTKPEPAVQEPTRELAEARRVWQGEYRQRIRPGDDVRVNRSGIEIQPLYAPADDEDGQYRRDLGFPGQPPFTRGIYPSMHRGRAWSQRQLIGTATPVAFNRRQRQLIDAGASALSLIPCNSVFRGYDVDQVEPELLGTCGTTVNTVDDMAACLEGIAIDRISVALNDPSPFTLSALLLAHAGKLGVPWTTLTGTSNQSDYLSHFVANHMFFRLALPAARRILVDHIAYMNEHVPGWNPLSVVGQHMQQAGATPAQAMAFTLSTALQYAEDCRARGLDLDEVLPRFTFFFDVSLSFFEEIAKLRAGRRLWARLTRDRLGARDPRSWRFKFHAQTSGADLTRQQPLNNIARVTVQAMAGIFGGLQSLHTDAYDEVLSTPTAEAARIATSTQRILLHEAHLDDVIDPLGGSYYVERLTDEMQAEIEKWIAKIDDAGGMYAAAESGLVQTMIGESALRTQQKIDRDEQLIVGVNAYETEDGATAHRPLDRPHPDEMAAQIARLQAFKAGRERAATRNALSALASAAASTEANVFAAVVEAAEAGLTHGEIVACLRGEMGTGEPLVVA
jgi:methylmalonyl-CoA mutase N-terminal domain/subunit